MSRRCAVCGAPSPLHGHHPTRRPAPDLPYFDPKLRIWLCVSCHGRCHNLLRDEGLDFLPEGANPLAYRPRVLAVHAGWLADHGRPLAVADGRASWALRELLLEAVAAVEARELVRP
jgi:hypothetical protein